MVLLLLAGAVVSPAQVAKPIKWACIGNSITAGYPQVSLAYAPRLATLLGPQFSVQNDGVSGTTLLKQGDMPYWTQGLLNNVFSFQPGLITIMLGTNDTKSQNWKYGSQFVTDLTAMVDTLQGISSHPKIWLCLPPPIFANSYGIADSILTKYIIPDIKQVAAAKGLKVIDVNTSLQGRSDLTSDGVHPTAAGSDSLAAAFYRGYSTQVTRVACIGNSITQYVGTVSGAQGADSYTSQLNMLFGPSYLTQNDGVSGTTLLKQGDMPYWTQGLLKNTFAFQPNVITLMLGTNDTKSQNWKYGSQFVADLTAMVDTLQGISSHPQIWLCLPPPISANGYGIVDSILTKYILPDIKQVAAAKALQVIDLNTPCRSLSSDFADGVHPNAQGQDTLAHVIYRALTSPVPVLNPIFSQRSARQLPGNGLPAATEEQIFSVDGKKVSAGAPVGPRPVTSEIRVKQSSTTAESR